MIMSISFAQYFIDRFVVVVAFSVFVAHLDWTRRYGYIMLTLMSIYRTLILSHMFRKCSELVN